MPVSLKSERAVCLKLRNAKEAVRKEAESYIGILFGILFVFSKNLFLMPSLLTQFCLN
jgi:hypothetical protein